MPKAFRKAVCFSSTATTLGLLIFSPQYKVGGGEEFLYETALHLPLILASDYNTVGVTALSVLLLPCSFSYGAKNTLVLCTAKHRLAPAVRVPGGGCEFCFLFRKQLWGDLIACTSSFVGSPIGLYAPCLIPGEEAISIPR